MKKITYFMSVKSVAGGEAWLEEMEGGRFDLPENDKDAKRVAVEVLNFFNDTLHATESERELLHVERHTTEIEKI